MPAEADLMDDVLDAVVTYQTPEAYMIGTVLIGALFAFLLAAVQYKQAYNDHLKSCGLSKAECPFSGKYGLGIVITTVAGAFLAYFGSGILLGLAGQQEAPEMVYYALAFVIGLVAGKYAGPFLRTVVDLVRDRLKIPTGVGPAGVEAGDDAAAGAAPQAPTGKTE